MRRNSRVLSYLALLGTAFAGLLLGHYLDYFIAIPDRHRRHAVLAASGHGYLRSAIVFVLAAAAVSVVAALVLGFRRARDKDSSPHDFRAIASRLCAVQVGAFIALEMGERLLSGGSFIEVASLLLVGTVAQVLISLLGSVILAMLAKAGEIISRILSPRRQDKSPEYLSPCLEELFKSIPIITRSTRGPPAELALN